MKCPSCGREASENEKFCQNCGYSFTLAEGKACAKCNATNDKNAKVCSECGFRFGEIARVKNGSKTSLLTTCPGCGSVYEVQRNKGFIITMAVLAGICFITSIFFLLGIVFAVLAILHAAGKLQGRMIKRCTVCHKTPDEIKKDIQKSKATKKQSENIQKAIQNRKDTPFVRVFAIVNKWIEDHITTKNIFPYFGILSAFLFVVTMFIKTEVELSWHGHIEKRYELLYLDSVLNFGESPLLMFSLIAIPFLFAATLFTNLKTVTRLKGIGFVAGAVTAIVEILLAIANNTLKEFDYAKTVYGERVIYDGETTLGSVNLLLILSAIILLASVFISFFIEREKQYQELKNQTLE